MLGPYYTCYKRYGTPIRRGRVPQRLTSNEDRITEQRLHRSRRHSLTLSSVSPSAHALNVPWNKRCSISAILPVTRRIESLNHTQSLQLRVKAVLRTSIADTVVSEFREPRFGISDGGVVGSCSYGASHLRRGVRLFGATID